MGDFDFLDKFINEEASKVDEFFFADELEEELGLKKKAGRPKEDASLKANKALRKAKGHLIDSIKRLEIYRELFKDSKK